MNPNIHQYEQLVKPVKLSKEERKKLRVIKKLINKDINGPKAASMLKVTTRQIRNLKRQVYNQGDFGVVHKNHYNKPSNTYEEAVRKEIAHIYRTEFRGRNFTFFAKTLEERGFVQSRSTIYNILRQNRIRSPQRKRSKRKKEQTNEN